MTSKPGWVLRVAAVLLALVALDRFTVLPWKCNRLIPQIEGRTRMALERLPPQAAARIAEENIQRLESVAPGCRHDVDFHLLLSFNQNILKRKERALQHLADALQVDDRPEIYFDRGMLLLEAGRLDDAVKEFATAAKFNPYLLDQLSGELRERVLAAAGPNVHQR